MLVVSVQVRPTKRLKMISTTYAVLGTEKMKHTGYMAGITAKPYMNSSIMVVVRLRPVYEGSPKATKISSEHEAEIRYALKSHTKFPTHCARERIRRGRKKHQTPNPKIFDRRRPGETTGQREKNNNLHS